MVPDDVEDVRLDKFLGQFYARAYSRTQIQVALRRRASLNGRPIPSPRAKVRAGDQIEFFMTIPDLRVRPHRMPLDILYEDKELIAVNKPAGQVVHPGNGTGEDTLVHALLAHTSLSGAGGELRPGVVHRLDKGTSGVILFAKTDEMYRAACVGLFAKRRVHKNYLALVEGIPSVRAGTISAPIGRHRSNRTKMVVCSGGKPAITHWSVEVFFDHSRRTLLACEPVTGRTHQIRVHLAHIGMPVVGDVQYGPSLPARRLFLHAQRLQFIHPSTQILLTIEAPLPPDFELPNL